MTTPQIQKEPVTFANALFTYYDIESLNNVFTLATYTPRTNNIEVFYLIDSDTQLDPVAPNGEHLVDPRSLMDRKSGVFSNENLPIYTNVLERIRAHVAQANPAWQMQSGNPGFRLHDLGTLRGNIELATFFGLSDATSVNDPSQFSSYGSKFRPVCDTDPQYDPINTHAYFAGYNSFSYDTTMLALYFYETFLKHSDHLIAIDKATTQEELTAARNAFTAEFTPTTARQMRHHNDWLFHPTYKSSMQSYLTSHPDFSPEHFTSDVSRIRRAMLHTGRHIDVSMLNEAQRKVGLKRLLGGEGRQILESDKLGSHNATIKTVDDLYELFAYNASDVIGLSFLASHRVYASAFDLKKSLLDEYPETIYDESSKGSYTPGIEPNNVRRNRLTPDSTSAKFVGLILSPYGDLIDQETVSFMYPSERVAQERGVERRNVLEDARSFFYENVSDEDARKQFDYVYNYYKSIEGQNFNSSDEYFKAYPHRRPDDVKDLAYVKKAPNNIPYFRKDGTPTSCYATFSTGGIHGAEVNMVKYQNVMVEYNQFHEVLQILKDTFLDPTQFKRTKEVTLTLADGSEYTALSKDFLTPKATFKLLAERMDLISSLEDLKIEIVDPSGEAEQQTKIEQLITQIEEIDELIWKPGPKKPLLFKPSKANEDPQDPGSTKPNDQFAFTSSGLVIHEDFTSYYPNMLRNISAFYNDKLGTDRYAKILDDKDKFQALSKQAYANGDTDAGARYNLMRNGTKLILNSASGAGDTAHYTPIRVNNAIISMRLLGQVFSWRIGQAQTLEGGLIISTNTDGLYSAIRDGFTEEINNRVLAEQQEIINVNIEPEPLVIVTKDSNNRLEIHTPDEGQDPWDAKIISASGGTLACHEGPQPTKSLAHPAITDWALARYLRYAGTGYVFDGKPITVNDPLNRELGMKLLLEATKLEDKVLVLRLFQNIVIASTGSLTFPFASDPIPKGTPPEEVKITNPRALQHYSRVFYVKDGVKDAVSLRAAGAWAIPPASKLNRSKNNLTAVNIDTEVALPICEQNGYTVDEVKAQDQSMALLPNDKDIIVRKITRLEPEWNCLIRNEDLYCHDQETLDWLISQLDLDVYLDLLETTYTNSWMNTF